MFSQLYLSLIEPQAEAENVPVPRLYDAVSEEYNARALRAMRTKFILYLPSDRVNDPETVRAEQTALRESLESLLWVAPDRAVIERVADLLGLLCAEYSWSTSPMISDDPARPEIDAQAAETGVLIAWILRRHGARLDETDPRVSFVAREQLRRRLFAPIVNHDDYPFMNNEGDTPMLIACDLLNAALLTEKTRNRRTPPVKKLLRVLDSLINQPQSTRIPLSERLTDACAIADTARIIKRMTRGQSDLTAKVPLDAQLDDILYPYIGSNAFLDPCGHGIERDLRGIDLFRLGYFSGDDALRALGAALINTYGSVASTVTGRVLSMEYLQAAFEEKKEPPRLKRAVVSDGMIALTRAYGFALAGCTIGDHFNSGDITMFFADRPILCDLGGNTHSLPRIDDHEPIEAPVAYPCDSDFNEKRDLISMDLTENYPAECLLKTYQRTLMLSRGNANVHIVEAFEFLKAPSSIAFRFVCADRCIKVNDGIRVGPLTLSWNTALEPAIEPYGEGYLITLTYRRPPDRFICDFTFDAADTAGS